MTKYFDEFLKDLLITCSSNKWRERQSSSLAIADLISGRDWAVVKPYIEELWVMLLRTFDDIKDSVREGGLFFYSLFLIIMISFFLSFSCCFGCKRFSEG